jgi:hypothetical protein
MTQLQSMSKVELIAQLSTANAKYLAATRNYYPVDRRPREHTEAYEYLNTIIQEIERRKAAGDFH